MKILVLVFIAVQFLDIHAFVDRNVNNRGGGSGGSRQGEGSWGVSVNRDQGRGPQIRTEGHGNIRDGNWRVDGYGTHEAGRGRKPGVEVGASVTGRWKRAINEAAENDENDSIVRSKRQYSPTPQTPKIDLPKPSYRPQPGDRGSVGISINQNRGTGPQIRTEAEGRIWTSRNGHWQLNGNGYHEAGRGRKPDYGGGVKFTGRFRRDAGEDTDITEITEAINEEEEEEAESAGRQKRDFAPNRRGPTSSQGQSQDRGSWGVSVNKDKGRGPQVRTEGQGNIYTSPKGNVRVDGHGHHEFGKGRKPDYGGGIRVEGRWRRSINEEEDSDNTQFEPLNEMPNRDKRETQDRGGWEVTVNKDKGRGPQVKTEGQGNIYTSPQGNVKVDAYGHHEFGKGRKPDYGGGIRVHGRFRREVDDEQQEVQIRDKRETQDRGGWEVTVNKDKGRGPQVKTEGQGNIYTSPQGNVKVDAYGHHEFGKGRKPDYGGGIRVHGRFRREVDDEQEEFQIRDKRETQDRGGWEVTVNKDKGRGPQVRTEGQGNIYTSPKGNVNVDAYGHHEFGKGRKPDYGGGIRVHGRFRREVDDEQQEVQIRDKRQNGPKPGDRGSVGVSINHDRGRGPQVRTDAQGRLWTSGNGNWHVNGNAFHEAGRGRKPDYGGGVSLTGRFRRETDQLTDYEEYEEAVNVQEVAGRQKRDFTGRGGGSFPSTSQSGDRGSWGVSVNKDKGRGPQVRTEGQGNIHTSKDGRVRVDAGGHHEFGKGRKPDYGGNVSVKGRWRRDIDDEDTEKEVTVENAE